MIIVGMGALARSDGDAVLALCREVAETFGMVGDDWNGFNLLHTAAARVGALELGFLPGGSDISEALGASADGNVVVGQARVDVGNEAFRWTSVGGIEGLGDLFGGVAGSFATGVSGDGEIVVGFSFAINRSPISLDVVSLLPELVKAFSTAPAISSS